GYPKIFQSSKSDDSSVPVTRGQRRLRFPQSEYQNNPENVNAAVAYLSNGKDTNGTDLWWAQKSNGSY
ncbi:MAG: SusD/RagB family nutrient-binding outer membrane lipoprotein, partial [Bacteroidales bacterium]|nr:SusD/RagB family nutrient-binding outer membrane lipoprotein [Bacteroidales bacterium]